MKISLSTICCFAVLMIPSVYAAKIKLTSRVIIYPAAAGENLSKVYTVKVSGKTAPVYTVKVAAADDKLRFKAVDDLMHSADYYDTAAFCTFDLQGICLVTVNCPYKITTAKVLPSSAMITPIIGLHGLSFKISSPNNLTVEINGERVKSLHLFVNPIETDVPKANDPNVIYFAPGVHYVSSMIIGDNKTVYVAGGAVIKALVGPDERFDSEPSGLRNYPPTFLLTGKNITFRGRGVLDASLCPTHARNFMLIKGRNIKLEGVIFKNSSGWTIPVRQSDEVTIDDVKLLGYRANSDGIDICNSRYITVKNSFIRTNDDLIVVKSWENQGLTRHIIIKKCVLWNQLAHALSIGAELRESVNDVLFSNCDIIHDTGREWSLRIFQSDSSAVSNIRFKNLRIEESHQFVSLWIGKNASSHAASLGTIANIWFENIQANGFPLTISLIGGNDQHLIDSVKFRNVKLNHQYLKASQIEANFFVKGISIID